MGARKALKINTGNLQDADIAVEVMRRADGEDRARPKEINNLMRSIRNQYSDFHEGCPTATHGKELWVIDCNQILAAQIYRSKPSCGQYLCIMTLCCIDSQCEMCGTIAAKLLIKAVPSASYC